MDKGRAYNFSAGPAVLPVPVLEQARDELLDYHGSGMSIMEQSHRGKDYDAVHYEAMENIRLLLELPEAYTVLFLQGGATAQFAMVPLNLLPPGRTADYTDSGSWAAKAIKEARVVGDVHIAADTHEDRPTRVPGVEDLHLSRNPAYLHITTNETISGAQWHAFPEVDTPLVADMSSDILSRPFDPGPFGLIYAGAQKNLGPAGVTLVIVRKEFLERVPGTVPLYLRYRTHAEADSLYNTPPTFSVYLVCLVTRWLRAQGGLTAIEEANRIKADLLYAAIDQTGFYTGTADPAHRSRMNVTFRLPTEALEAQFVSEAEAGGLKGLKGHRSVGGLRASIYNAFPAAGVEALVGFMADFERKNG
jgi:phosphoserine aminotransferase